MALQSIFPDQPDDINTPVADSAASNPPPDLDAATILINQKAKAVQSFRELYDAGDIGMGNTSSQMSLSDIPKFLFGPDMSSYGLITDWSSFGDATSKFLQKFQDDPVWTAIDIAGVTLAAGGPLFRSYKMGALGKALNKGFKFYANDRAVQALPNLLTQDKFFHWFDMNKTAEQEVKTLRSLGYLQDDAQVTPSVVSRARAQTYADSRMRYINTKGFYWDDYNAKLNLEALKVGDVMKLPHTDPQVMKQATENLSSAGVDVPDISLLERGLYKFNKMFGQQLGALQQDPSPVGPLRRMLHQRFDDFSQDSLMMNQVLPQVETLNSPAFATKMYKHAAYMLSPTAYGDRKLPDLDPYEQNVMDTWLTAAKAAQQQAKDLGLISENQPIVHLIGLTEAGVEQGEIPALAHANSLAEALYSPTLLPRSGRTVDTQMSKILDRMDQGNLQATASMHNLINGYMNDQMLMHNFEVVRDILTEVGPDGNLTKRYAIPAAEILKGKTKATYIPGYLSLDKFFANEKFTSGGRALSRVLDKHLPSLGIDPEDFFGPNGELPYVNETVMRHVFGKDGMWDQGRAANLGVLAFLTSIHKFSKSVLNPGSNMQNDLGNFATASMGGFNMLDPEHIRLQKTMYDVFNDIHGAQVEALKVFKTNTPTKTQVISYVSRELEKTGRIVDYRGTKVPISVYALPLVQNLYSEGAFDSHEAFGHLKRVYEENGMTKEAAALAKRTFSLYDADIPGWNKLRDMANAAQKNYLAGDIVPKLAMFTKFYAEGQSVESAVSEVARRMPMYGVVGRYIAGSRSVVLPWVTFPAEMVRIFKNNIMDNPWRVLPWMVAPGIAQTLLSSMGMAPGSPDDVAFAKRELPFWGQTPGTIVTQGQQSAAAASGIQNSLFGAVIGSRLGGITGAVGGAVAGGVLPLALQAINSHFEDQQQANKELRGAVLNWLPFTSFLPKTRSPDYSVTNLQDLWGQLPAEPFAVIRALLEPVFGQTEFGEIKAPSLGAKAAKSLTNLLGFLAPPWIQKYGFHSPTPDLGIMDLMVGPGARSGDIAGGGALGATVGAAVAGKAGAAIGGAAGAGLGALFGTPNVTNLRRLMVDTGAYNDSVTGRPGSPLFDFLLNTSGAWKSYEARGEVLESNRSRIEDQALGELRSYYAKQLSFYAENNDQQGLGHSLQSVFDSYTMQYMGDPKVANEKFGEWLFEQAKSLGRHPALRGMSDKDITDRIKGAVKFSTQMRGASYDAWRSSLLKERQIRALTSWQSYWAAAKQEYGSEDRQSRGYGQSLDLPGQ